MADVIVLGYDESPSANAALAATIRIAPVVGAKVVVVFGFYISPLGGLQEGQHPRGARGRRQACGRPCRRRPRGGRRRGRVATRPRQAGRRADRGRERGRRPHDRRRDGRGEPDHRCAPRLGRAAPRPALAAAGARRPDERGLMAVGVPVEIDRSRVRELIEREGARLDERTPGVEGDVRARPADARRRGRLVVPAARAVADLPRRTARASASGTWTATSTSTSTTASAR